MKSEEDEDAVVADGEIITVNMMTMDSMQRAVAGAAIIADTATMHRPGAAVITDAERGRRITMYDKANASLVNAWKNPPPLATDKPPAKVAVADHYGNYNNRLQDAWRFA